MTHIEEEWGLDNKFVPWGVNPTLEMNLDKVLNNLQHCHTAFKAESRRASQTPLPFFFFGPGIL